MFKKSNFIDICRLDVRQIDTSSEYVHIFYFLNISKFCMCWYWLKINILRHSRRFFRCACKAILPAAP
ncbi:hypothetical protein DVF23_17935 [Salmonella enterica subsp. enterica serovar Teko]|nr:hypothetical protein [Salmonella enterica subsp. enterica serovar Teko]